MPLTELRYSRAALRRDYARAGIGFIMCLALALLMPMRAIAFWPILATAALFLGFGVLTAVKQAMVIEIGDGGVRRRLDGPLGSRLGNTTIDFAELDHFVLRYFGGRRDRGRGIVELTIRAGRNRLTIDQALEGFDDLILRCRAAAERRGIALDPATTANLSSLRFG